MTISVLFGHTSISLRLTQADIFQWGIHVFYSEYENPLLQLEINASLLIPLHQKESNGPISHSGKDRLCIFQPAMDEAVRD